MDFSNLIKKVPIPFDTKRGIEVGDTFPTVTKKIRELLTGVAGCSPYLKSLIEKENSWLLEAFSFPDTAIQHEFKRLNSLSNEQLNVGLRQAKRRIALWTALCDLSGAWTLKIVTNTLTEFADLSCELALRAAIQIEARRGYLPGIDEFHSSKQIGMFVLAMGKMGARELNYSSDIDLICFFDETKFSSEDFFEARKGFIRVTRAMTAMLNDLNEEGYVFRTDLRLRPNPSVTPVCTATDAAERYYESIGRTWERAAYIKARVAAGDKISGNAFLKMLTPFVWRKYLDFAAIEDAHDMRLRIREHKSLGGPINLPGHNIKLGLGGIREIEFFTQTRQLIAGGRDIKLRVSGTVEGLSKLAEQGWIKKETADELIEHYEFYRSVEHRLQMINDAQTHDLPKSSSEMVRLSCLMSTTRETLETDLKRRLTKVHALTEGFFSPTKVSQVISLSDTEIRVISRWSSYPVFRSPRAEKIFTRLKTDILKKLRFSDKSGEALISFDQFLEGLPTGVQLFSLFEANPDLVDLLVDIISSSPNLANHLAKNPQVFDAVIGSDFWSAWPGIDILADDLNLLLDLETDYEKKLETVRRWKKEWHFRIGVHLLRGLSDTNQASLQYAELAEVILQVIWPRVILEFSSRHGNPPGRGAVVLGMGSLGSKNLNPTSDLDLIIIYDADDIESSNGRVKLNTRVYYSRLTQALITAVTAQMSQGKLYELDMRLRPSGRKGPVATSWTAFRDYQRKDAWLWEHLALTQSRVITGPESLSKDIEKFRISLMGKTDIKVGRKALSEMRIRISKHNKTDEWNFKIGPGKIQDIELLSQLGALIHGTNTRNVDLGLDSAAKIGLIDSTNKIKLIHIYSVLSTLNTASLLISATGVREEAISSGGVSLLLRLTSRHNMTGLKNELLALSKEAANIIDLAVV